MPITTPVRGLFVGGLCITAVFLMSYKAFEKNLDNTLSFVAGFAAVTVAFFPKSDPGHVGTTPLQDKLGEGFVEVVHFAAASIFIAALGVACYFFGRREGNALAGRITGRRGSGRPSISSVRD